MIVLPPLISAASVGVSPDSVCQASTRELAEIVRRKSLQDRMTVMMDRQEKGTAEGVRSNEQLVRPTGNCSVFGFWSRMCMLTESHAYLTTAFSYTFCFLDDRYRIPIAELAQRWGSYTHAAPTARAATQPISLSVIRCSASSVTVLSTSPSSLRLTSRSQMRLS